MGNPKPDYIKTVQYIKYDMQNSQRIADACRVFIDRYNKQPYQWKQSHADEYDRAYREYRLHINYVQTCESQLKEKSLWCGSLTQAEIDEIQPATEEELAEDLIKDEEESRKDEKYNSEEVMNRAWTYEYKPTPKKKTTKKTENTEKPTPKKKAKKK